MAIPTSREQKKAAIVWSWPSRHFPFITFIEWFQIPRFSFPVRRSPPPPRNSSTFSRIPPPWKKLWMTWNRQTITPSKLLKCREEASKNSINGQKTEEIRLSVSFDRVFTIITNFSGCFWQNERTLPTSLHPAASSIPKYCKQPPSEL